MIKPEMPEHWKLSSHTAYDYSRNLLRIYTLTCLKCECGITGEYGRNGCRLQEPPYHVMMENFKKIMMNSCTCQHGLAFKKEIEAYNEELRLAKIEADRIAAEKLAAEAAFEARVQEEVEKRLAQLSPPAKTSCSYDDNTYNSSDYEAMMKRARERERAQNTRRYNNSREREEFHRENGPNASWEHRAWYV